MHPLYLRAKARQLRVDKKLTIDELAECLALPRTTIYYWVRDLPVSRKTRAEWPESARLAGGRAVRKKFRLLREAAYTEGRASFVDLCADSTFRDFVNLYIAEGYKRCRNSVSLSNSDPVVIRLATHWIRRFTKNPIDYRIAYHQDQDLGELQAFWGAELGIRPGSIVAPAEVEQQPPLRKKLALALRGFLREIERHVSAGKVGSLDGLPEERMVRLVGRRGVAKPGHRASFGGRRTRVRIPAPRLTA